MEALGIGENVFSGLLNPVTQLWTEDYLNRHAPDVEFYATDGRGYSLKNSKNTRVILVLIKSASPDCRNSVAVLNQLYNEFSLGDLRILAVSQEPSANLDAFVKQTGAKFPVGKAAILPAEPYGDVQSFPTYFVLDREGIIEKILIGPQPVGILRAAAKGP
jgi:peroxiredoxin